MDYTYAVSFEYDDRPAQTARGRVTADHHGTAARRAICSAQSQLTPRCWRSLVCTLERLPGASKGSVET